jgi:hypothetical protein
MYLLEGRVTSLSSISHNGGQSFGINSKLRREKFVQPDFSVEEIPVISGNAMRGVLRDRAMLHLCRQLGYGVVEETGTVQGLPLSAFYFLFSGGALESKKTREEGKGKLKMQDKPALPPPKSKAIDIDYARRLRALIPLVGIFGGALGSMILPGKLKMGKLIPICAETLHVIPEAHQIAQAPSIWEYLQEEMYTRTDDAKNEHYRPLIARASRQQFLLERPQQDRLLQEEIPDDTPPGGDRAPQQMRYFVETLGAGTPFYWKIVLDDVTNLEFEAFLTALVQFSRMPYVGGKSNIGLGEIAITFDKWLSIDSRLHPEGKAVSFALGTQYQEHLQNKAAEIKDALEAMA